MSAERRKLERRTTPRAPLTLPPETAGERALAELLDAIYGKHRSTIQIPGHFGNGTFKSETHRAPQHTARKRRGQ